MTGGNSLTLVVVGQDEQSLGTFDFLPILPEISVLVLVNNRGRTWGYGEIGNRYLESCATRVLGIVHADTQFWPGSLTAFCQAAERGMVAGIVGRTVEGAYRWCNGSEAGPGSVSTLDGSALFVRPDVGVRFDTEAFPGLHCCVEDFCLQAAARGVGVVVPGARASHVGAQGHGADNAAWQREYWSFRERLQQKWSGVRFMTT